ncbi:methyltransferase 1 MttB15 [Acetobacterium woodii DSM 1030]|uniref:Methyltransferase 1 MttB15 n=1 Tax=Acetobacterium woodii (strain ATCC 29683 / DSM 1030 / JCM 2381 / KCTC 1655 / WB1) TaxID=931626 RepID=H6LGP6_ACEWD|nr:uroporphyrinogen decarboxylase family protein [Acetobacterium woodii]AFA48374.1 methyltransferase 1 MttB15 [Acetobacterium woodii DSM 1030]
MEKIPFDPKELQIVGEIPNMFGVPDPIYDFPITMKENYLLTMQKEPVWESLGNESGLFCPSVVPDNIARAFVFEANMMPPQDGIDMFGIPWEYVPDAQGSMVRPGNHILKDANDWKSVIKFPDIDSWDWAGSAKANNGTFLNGDTFVLAWQINGWWFERLISFMGFEGAAEALIDEDQQAAVKEIFEATTDLACRIVDKFVENFDYISGFTVHDDWGSQRSPFFSEATAQEMIVPYMKKLTDHIHAKGLWADLHSCGHIESRIQCILDAGWDSWSPQNMNDTIKLFEKYGDQICIGLIPEVFDPLTTSEDDQREYAKKFAEKVCIPGKSSFISVYALIAGIMTPVFREELYKQSRILYSK